MNSFVAYVLCLSFSFFTEETENQPTMRRIATAAASDAAAATITATTASVTSPGRSKIIYIFASDHSLISIRLWPDDEFKVT
jgi:hypothetical protein